MQTWIILLLIIIGLVIILGITFLIISFLGRRKIKIVLDNYSAQKGGKITGKLILNLNPALEINSINVGISCYMIQTSHGSKGTKKDKDKIFDFEKPIKIKGAITKGLEVPFELAVPNDSQTGINKIENNVAKAAVGVISALSGFSKRYEWYVTAKVDKKGLDINNWQKIIVN